MAGGTPVIMIMDGEGLKDLFEAEDGFLIQKPASIYMLYEPILAGARPFVLTNGHEWVNDRKLWSKTLPLMGRDQLIGRSNASAFQITSYIKVSSQEIQ